MLFMWYLKFKEESKLGVVPYKIASVKISTRNYKIKVYGISFYILFYVRVNLIIIVVKW